MTFSVKTRIGKARSSAGHSGYGSTPFFACVPGSRSLQKRAMAAYCEELYASLLRACFVLCQVFSARSRTGSCRIVRVRKEYADANKLIMPEIERRKERAEKAIAAGSKPPKTADTIGWMYEVARGRQVNYVAAQLSLTLAAIHTTTEAITTAMLDIIEQPEVLRALRQEVVDVVGEQGWSKTALYKLRLMDSFLKESQRCHPPGFTSMNRLVKSDVQLSDGTVLPAGARIMIAPRYLDPDVYEEPLKFDAYRFLREREKPGQRSTWVWSWPACLSGRFFASNEIKIALAHLLLKYDWRADPTDKTSEMQFEGNVMTDPKVKVQLRRRAER
ncbi:hypothetical protein BTJ68_15600 [Hortaea werneckii EXF-2000]|uniref:Cytochrome P450 n=1 Tax=Hortaea werneckii EXF-2000 TaxID=1157616 RepID=A0A1Z5SKY7_HORWE|nr:hypothetical protein BTJ68_15600 [Hortaea werneckii EXF-2000]